MASLTGPQFVGLRSFELFALTASVRNALYTPIPNGLDRGSNRALWVLTLVKFTFSSEPCTHVWLKSS